MMMLQIKKPTFGIRHKIILTIYLVLFPVLIATSGFIYYSNYNNTLKEAKSQYNSVIQSIDDNIRFMENDISDISVYFSVNSDIHNLLADPTASLAKDSLFWIKQAPMDVMKDIFAIKDHMRTIILYPENGLPPFFVSCDASVHDTSIENIRSLPIYERTVEAMGNAISERINAGEQGLFISNRTDKIVFCRELFDLSKKRRLGFMAITVDVSWYERICRNALLHGNEAIIILNSDGSEIARAGEINDEILAHIKAGNYELGGDYSLPHYGGWYIFSSGHNNAGKTIYYLSPQSNWSAWIYSGLILPAVLAVTLLVCVWPLSFLASKILSRPIDKLCDSMNKFKTGDFKQQVEVVGSDEIAGLSIAFNHMVSDLNELIERNYIMALRERESELNALQAQINPHFLYNTLGSLYWQAVDSGQEKLSEDILSMSELFRLLLSSGDSDIQVKQELEIITHYLHIQKMRFLRKFDYSINVDEQLLDILIPKLILQPFVENAVVHGLEQKDVWGGVKVEGVVEGDMMVFTIEDNGTGMSPETLEGIFSENVDRRYANQRIGRYAIRNVKERLKLKYNSHCKLEINSKLGEGSKVCISLPLKP